MRNNLLSLKLNLPIRSVDRERKKIIHQFFLISSIYLYFFLYPSSAKSQIAPDGTLPTDVTQSGNVFEITGGEQQGNNLFHSFQEFSLPTGSEAFFKNTTNVNNVDNIIGRVTGGSISNIDGLIRENYGANLILLNPSGINFGTNAQLDIGGSFLGSTANSVVFADGSEFSAIAPQSQLTISVPLGLQMGQNPGAINIEGSGHNLSLTQPIFSPFTRGDVGGLKVQPGQTLALIGGNITLEGGTLTAEGGRIELGSVSQGLVDFTAMPQGWTFGYQGASTFNNIELKSRSLVDVSGVSSGSIHLQGKQIAVSDGSTVLIQNQGEQASGMLKVNATEALKVSGTTLDGTIASSLFTETLDAGKGGDITISAPQVIVEGGAVISAATFGSATGGHIEINAGDSIQIVGFSAINPTRFSNITAATFGAGNAGNIEVSTKQLTALNGGNIASVTGGPFGTGSGGNLSINVTDSVELIGVTPGIFTPSQITAGTGGSGKAGDVTVKTQKLIVRDGGRVDASTTASGNAGSVTIAASESVEVNGRVPGSLNPSLISSSANILDEPLRQLLGLPPIPSGNSGNVTIDTPQLNVTDGALITARNDGTGLAGNVMVQAQSIFLSNGASISSELGGRSGVGQFTGFSTITLADGKSGDIKIATEQLVLRDGATISTSTFTNGTAGNISIDASESVEVNAASPTNPNQLSSIGSSAFSSGSSGNITISTRTLTILNGGLIVAGTFSTGNGGDITINANELVEVIGVGQIPSIQSLIGGSAFNAGNAGDVIINVPKLVVRDGGRIDSSTAATGKAGSIIINAPESVKASGAGPQTDTVSQISSSGSIEDELTRQFFGLPDIPTGDSGSVTINTSQLSVSDKAIVSARNDGLGNAGDITVNADSISLNNSGSITATTQSGQGGNIQLKAKDYLQMAANSQISSLNFGAGNGGDISIETARFSLSDGAFVTTTTLAQGAGGNLALNASESVEIIGTGFADFQRTIANILARNPNLADQRNGLFTGSLASGVAGDLSIATGQLNLREGAIVATAALGEGRGGNLAISSSTGMEVSASGLAVTTSGSSSAGILTIDTTDLTVSNGGTVSTSSFASGPGGDLLVNASGLVELKETPDDALTPTGIFTNSVTGTGKAGKAIVNARQLIIRDGSSLSAQSGGFLRTGAIVSGGEGGNLTVNVSDSVEVTGASPDGQFPSAISTATFGDAAAGNLSVSADKIKVGDGATIAVNSFGSGNAGTLEISANNISLDRGGTLSAATTSGEGGNISLQADSLVVRDNSQISAAAAGGTGNGGNVTITGLSADNLAVLLEQSKIEANAFEGRGGNIQINARGLFICPDCQISASSELGVEGVVEITTPEAENNLEFVDLPQEVVQPEEKVAIACSERLGKERSQFIVTGRGGLPPRPIEPLSSEALVSIETPTKPVEKKNDSQLPPPARGWYVNAEGTVILADRSPVTLPYDSGLTTPDCQAN
jgi:filamentous hemagglutinin family protein